MAKARIVKNDRGGYDVRQRSQYSGDCTLASFNSRKGAEAWLAVMRREAAELKAGRG